MSKILLVDKQTSFRRGVRMQLSLERDVAVALVRRFTQRPNQNLPAAK